MAIPVLLILAFRQKNNIPIRSFLFGIGLALLTGGKFLFLIKQQLFSGWGPVYVVLISILVEWLVREWVVHRWDQWESKAVAIQFVAGYLFTKIFLLGLSYFLISSINFVLLSNHSDSAKEIIQSIQPLLSHILLVFQSVFHLGYIFILFIFIIIRVRLKTNPLWQRFSVEALFIFLQGFILLVDMAAINDPRAPIGALFFAVISGTVGLGYYLIRSINELPEAPSIAS